MKWKFIFALSIHFCHLIFFLNNLNLSQIGERELVDWELKHLYLVYYYLRFYHLALLALPILPRLHPFARYEVHILSKSKHAIKPRQFHLYLSDLQILRTYQPTVFQVLNLTPFLILIFYLTHMTVFLIQQIVVTKYYYLARLFLRWNDYRSDLWWYGNWLSVYWKTLCFWVESINQSICTFIFKSGFVASRNRPKWRSVTWRPVFFPLSSPAISSLAESISQRSSQISRKLKESRR